MAEEENKIEMKEEGADIAPFDPTKKKKKKKVVIQDFADDSVEKLAEKTESLSDTVHQSSTPSSIIMSHPFDVSGDSLLYTSRRTFMRPLQVLREGTKKTVFVDFMDICRKMHRQAEHVMTFLLAELGTSGSLDGQQRLVVKGRFAPKIFEGILRRYINEYVICNGCKSRHTILSKENRIFFLRCEKCGSGRIVAQIKAKAGT